MIIHATVEDADRFRAAHASKKPASTANDLRYNGGTGGIGVETKPKVYLVLWGSQWNNNDPSAEFSILQNFYDGVGGSSWLNSVTQYCQGVRTGTVSCNSLATHAGNPTGILAQIWSDSTSAAPTHPKQSQLAAEAVRAAQHFGNTTAAANASVQYVIATATRNSAKGFGS